HAACLPAPGGGGGRIEPSPYLPTSRRFVNPLYLRVEAIPEYADLPKRGRIQDLRERVQRRAARSDTIDRDSSWAAKCAALKLVHAVPRSA
ncbi:4-alpha-glucanotransferase, partial [Mycobacterium kansasii]